MSIVIFDLEATCWEKDSQLKRIEIIEIGAVKLDNNTLQTIDEFSSFIRPVENPVLSDFCTALTSIRQQDVENADDFRTVFQKFIDWIGPSSYKIASWGDYDIKQLSVDCKQHEISFPKKIRKKHINLKKLFASQRNIKPCGMAAALQILRLPLQGTHHRGIDDARNIARIARVILPNALLQA